MAQTKQVIAFPHYFFFSMIAPLNLEELDHLAHRDTLLLIQYLDGVLRICEIRLEWCDVRHYNIHGFLQTLLQL
jgi:hypothetical protein